MEMEGSGARPLTQPPPAKEIDEAAAALVVTKRARKRSRYLCPPYTDTDVQEKEEEEEEEEAPPDVSTAEVLSALRAAALRQVQGPGHGQGADAAPLRFLALYRRRTIDNHPPDPNATAGGGSHDDGSNKPPSAASGGAMLSLNAGPAIMPTAGDGSALLAKKKRKKNPQPPVFAAVKQQNVHEHDAHGNIWAFQSPGFAAASAAYGVANPVALPKKKKYRKRMKTSPDGQHYYFGNPVALVLDFAEGTPLPSKEDLISTFRRFGFVIDSETAVAHGNRSARVAFAARAQAEAAYSCAEPLGTFGPPFAAASLQDLPPITLSTPAAPVPKLPLMDIRNNLEKMILSLTCSSSSFEATEGAANSHPGPEARLASANLAGEMQSLLAKVNKKLQSASATAPHRRH
ncbi:hypothetical protein BS78_09G007400 [Paspalum vaginatum]|uniref:Uncharacterized protein n=1 Tax=Paspalum vaginatum TaxID=158149 RepID=A0A9W7X9S0_9POAL|nr:hypothetical protein BS78_K282600 [Paspalum vaginatum]KAJ1261171.1 hypothetical protein BS78_09G007400 [Paspalum vaginatum]